MENPIRAGNASGWRSGAYQASLSRHGAPYGLCQTYGNEPWHYELRRAAAVQGCPPMYADPRMQR